MGPTMTLRDLGALADRDPAAAHMILTRPFEQRGPDNLPMFVADDGRTVLVTEFSWTVDAGKARLSVVTEEWTPHVPSPLFGSASPDAP